MNISLRQAIIQRVQQKNVEELYDIVESSVHSEERTLPGLGVLFEIIWEHSDEADRQKMISTLNEHVPH